MGEWRYSTTFLDFGTRPKRVVSYKPLLLYPWGKGHSIQETGGWVSPKASLDAVEKRKSCSARIRTWAVSSKPVAIPSYPDSMNIMFHAIILHSLKL
jgi:hypothetical protein